MTAPITPDERAAVAEYLRQFDRLRDTGGLIHSVHTDPDSDGVDLTAGDLRRLLDALDTAEAEAARSVPVGPCARCSAPVVLREGDPQNLEMECCPSCVADLFKDPPAPVWDEATARAEVDCESLRRFVDSFCDDEAGEVEHVVSADGTSGFALTGGNDAHAVLCKAASALWPGESRATVQAEALRDAADAVTEIDGRRDDAAARWLRARADRLEKGADRG